MGRGDIETFTFRPTGQASSSRSTEFMMCFLSFALAKNRFNRGPSESLSFRYQICFLDQKMSQAYY